MGYHAKLSPSSAYRWSSCTASVGATEGIPNEGNDAARNGTCCHQIAAEVLELGDLGLDLQDYLGRTMHFWIHPESDSSGEDWAENFEDTRGLPLEVVASVKVTQDMLDAVAVYVKYVRDVHALTGGFLEIEQRVPIGQFTGEEGATGSADAIIVAEPVFRVVDGKFGRLPVAAFDWIEPPGYDVVTGESTPGKKRPNLQMACYALGALHKFGSVGVTHVTMTIVQPYIDHIEEYTCTVEELREVEAFLRDAARRTRTKPEFKPGYHECHFCLAKGNCQAQTAWVLNHAFEGFDDGPQDVDKAVPKPIVENQLGSLFEIVPAVRDWCEAIDSMILAKLKAGETVMNNRGQRYKLVAGKMGARAWTEPERVELYLKRMRLKRTQMFNETLISPTDAEKLAKVKKPKKGETPVPPVIGEKQWMSLQKFIRQRDGKDAPVVVLETDPRPELPGKADGFDDVASSAVDSDLADFF